MNDESLFANVLIWQMFRALYRRHHHPLNPPRATTTAFMYFDLGHFKSIYSDAVLLDGARLEHSFHEMRAPGPSEWLVYEDDGKSTR